MDTCPRNHERFVHFDDCLILINKLKSNLTGNEPKEAGQAEKLVESFRKIVDTYQEQPELLDGHLESIINQLTEIVLQPDVPNNQYHAVFKFLYNLIKVRGFKSISKRFPHDTDKLKPLVDLLEKQDELASKKNWETRYVLTVWLSIVVLVPFDLAKFDDGTQDIPLADRIFNLLLKNLGSHDSCQHATAFCLAKFLTRSDVNKQDKHLDKFIDLTIDNLADIKLGRVDSLQDVNLIGYLRSLNYIFKMGSRQDMKSRCQRVLGPLSRTDIEKVDRELIRQLLIKLCQRIGLNLLPNRVAPWRYSRGNRILGKHIDADNVIKHGVDNQMCPTEVNDEEYCAPDLEPIINSLFVGVQDSQTKIRYSSAKGLARIANRLPKESADDILDAVFDLMKDETNEHAWHGGCLTIAEMARYGLILPEKLNRTAELIKEAIIYDKNKGSFSVGTNVRDAACYCCWAMARVYDESLLKTLINSISTALICTMVFDREVQCRRAASAAFQELVGRQGSFTDEEGIDIISNADYQNVGQRTIAYLQLSTYLAKFKKYSQPLVEHLVEKKIGHWDIQVRRLASEALSGLILHVEKDFIDKKVIPALIEMTVQTENNNIKHGGIQALSKVITGLRPLQSEYSQDLIDHVSKIAQLCKKQLESKQAAPIFMEAICNIIIAANEAQLLFKNEDIHPAGDSNVLSLWESIALSALDCDEENLRSAGASALISMCVYSYKDDKTSQDRILTSFNQLLKSANESSRRGGLKGLSKMSELSKLDCDTLHVVLISLTEYMKQTTQVGTKVFAHAKADACLAFTEFLFRLEPTVIIVSSTFITSGFDSLIECAQDYTSDQRGDIGVVVRRAAIKSMKELAPFLVNINVKTMFDKDLVGRMMAAIAQQAVYHNDLARELAGQSFYHIANSSVPNIPEQEFILAIGEREKLSEDFNWRDDSTPAFVSLLGKPHYSMSVWKGLIPSLGQTSDAGAKQFRVALQEYLIKICKQKDETIINQVYWTFLQTLQANENNQRILVSGFITTEFLLTSGLFNDVDEKFQLELIKFCWKHKGVDLMRLMLVSKVLCAMLQFPSK